MRCWRRTMGESDLEEQKVDGYHEEGLDEE